MTLEMQHIKRLYELLEQLEDAGKSEDVAVMRWAIFELERKFNIKIGNLDEESFSTRHMAERLLRAFVLLSAGRDI